MGPSWIFDRGLKTSMKLMWYYILYVMVVSKKIAALQK